jgi:hypothetical protein
LPYFFGGFTQRRKEKGTQRRKWLLQLCVKSSLLFAPLRETCLPLLPLFAPLRETCLPLSGTIKLFLQLVFKQIP